MDLNISTNSGLDSFDVDSALIWYSTTKGGLVSSNGAKKKSKLDKTEPEFIETTIGKLSWDEVRKVVDRCRNAKDHRTLWELAKCLPAEAAVEVLAWLGREKWEPAGETDPYYELVQKATVCEKTVFPFKKLSDSPLDFEDAITLDSFCVSEPNGILVGIDKPELQTRIRVWNIESGALTRTILGPEVKQGAFDPHQIAVSDDGEWVVSVHLGATLCLWSIAEGSYRVIEDHDVSPALDARPAACWVGTVFVIAGMNGTAVLLDPHDASVTQISVSNSECSLLSVVPGSSEDSAIATTSDKTIVEIRTGENAEASTLFTLEKAPGILTYAAQSKVIFVSTLDDRLLSVSTTGEIISTQRYGHKLHLVDMTLFADESKLILVFPEGFLIVDARTLEAVLFVPHASAVLNRARGNTLYLTSSQEHAIYLDSTGRLRRLSYRFALMMVVPCANLTLPMLTWLETVRTSAPEWVDFIQSFVEFATEGEIRPNWETIVSVRNPEFTEEEDSVDLETWKAGLPKITIDWWDPSLDDPPPRLPKDKSGATPSESTPSDS